MNNIRLAQNFGFKLMLELWDKSPPKVHAMPRNDRTKHKGL